MCYGMVVTQGSGSNNPDKPGTNDDDFRWIVAIEVTAEIRGAISEMFGSIKTMLIKTFDKRYATITEATVVAATTVVSAVRPQGGDSLWYREFNNMKPTEFDGT